MIYFANVNIHHCYAKNRNKIYLFLRYRHYHTCLPMMFTVLNHNASYHSAKCNVITTCFGGCNFPIYHSSVMAESGIWRVHIYVHVFILGTGTLFVIVARGAVGMRLVMRGTAYTQTWRWSIWQTLNMSCRRSACWIDMGPFYFNPSIDK